jgi:hypothetical protein
LSSQVGVGTKVNAKVLPNEPARRARHELPEHLRSIVSGYRKPKPFVNWVMFPGCRAFSMRNPALSEFPAELACTLPPFRLLRSCSGPSGNAQMSPPSLAPWQALSSDDVVDAPLEIRLTARSKHERACGKGSYHNA